MPRRPRARSANLRKQKEKEEKDKQQQKETREQRQREQDEKRRKAEADAKAANKKKEEQEREAREKEKERRELEILAAQASLGSDNQPHNGFEQDDRFHGSPAKDAVDERHEHERELELLRRDRLLRQVENDPRREEREPAGRRRQDLVSRLECEQAGWPLPQQRRQVSLGWPPQQIGQWQPPTAPIGPQMQMHACPSGMGYTQPQPPHQYQYTGLPPPGWLSGGGSYLPMAGGFASPMPHAYSAALDDTPPGEVDMERKLSGLRSARNVPAGDAAQMAMEEGMLRFDLERAKRKRKMRQ